MQSSKYELRRGLAGVDVKDLSMVFTSGGRTYRLMIRRGDDCLRLVLISEDYELIESGCMDHVGLGTIMKFLRSALPH